MLFPRAREGLAHETGPLDPANASVPGGRVHLLGVRGFLPEADPKLPGLRRNYEEDES